tara:strand:+ start:1588 stop:1788 length:201 start_codon:yes stop_codon:yes gene_type:complete
MQRTLSNNKYMKQVWIIHGKGYFNNESFINKYGTNKFFGTEDELEAHLEDLYKDESTFKVIGVFPE